jgi:hypothetical protein
MLAYAAQGVTGEEEGNAVTKIRAQLKRGDEALEGLFGAVKKVVAGKRLKRTQPCNPL